MTTERQLVRTVFALSGTVAEQVLREMERVNNLRRDQDGGQRFVRLEFLTYTGQAPRMGLSLELSDRRPKTFSLKYRLISPGLLALPIGKALLERRVTHVAESILAMIARGNHWSDHGRRQPRAHELAYGPKRQTGNRKHRLRQNRRQQRLRDCHTGLFVPSGPPE